MDLSPQFIFDKTWVHLVTQGKPALRPGSIGLGQPKCVYRAPDGSSCAFGVWIDDAEYNPEWEGKPADYIIEQGLRRYAEYENLFSALQRAHDSVDSWTYDRKGFDFDRLRQAFKYIARDFNLNTEILDKEIPHVREDC